MKDNDAPNTIIDESVSVIKKQLETGSLLQAVRTGRATMASLLSAILLLFATASLRADEFAVTDGFFGQASTPNTLAWAIEQANASAAPDNVITIANNLQIVVDGAAFTGVLELARITRSVRIEGHNATLVGNPSFVTTGGLAITKNNPQKRVDTDIPVEGSYSFVNIGLEGQDNSGIHVVINNLNADGLNRFARVEQKARLDVTGGSIDRSVNFTPLNSHTPGFIVETGGTLNVSGLKASRNFALTHDAGWLGFFQAVDATLNLFQLEVTDSVTGGILVQAGGATKVVNSVFKGSGGASVAATGTGPGTAGVVNSVFFMAGGNVYVNGLDRDLLPNRIQAIYDSTVDFTASSVLVDMGSLEPSPAVLANGIPLTAADGGTINLKSSAVMVGENRADFPDQIAYQTAGVSTPGTLTADAYCWTRATARQSIGDLRVLFSQPALQGVFGLIQGQVVESPFVGSLYPFPEGSYPLDAGLMIDVIPDADGANQLLNPINNSVISTDVFGDPRTTGGKRNIGAVQVRKSCKIFDANDWYDLTPYGSGGSCLTLNQYEPWSGAFEGEYPSTMTHGMTSGDLDYRAPNGLWTFFQHLTWRGKVLETGSHPSIAVPGEDPWPAAIYGIDFLSGGGVILPKTRDIVVETLDIVDANLNLIDINLKFRGTENRLSLHNAGLNLRGGSTASSLTDHTLVIDVPSTPAAPNRSSLEGMVGQPGGPIHLSLQGGAELTIKASGDINFGQSDDARLWWSDTHNEISLRSASKMRLDESYLIVRTTTDLGTVNGRLEVTEGSSLELRGTFTGLQTDRLVLSNGGTLDLGANTILTGRSFPSGNLAGVTQLIMDDGILLARESADALVKNLTFGGSSQIRLDDLGQVTVQTIQGAGPGAALSVTREPGIAEPAFLRLHSEFRDGGIGFEGGNIAVGPGVTFGVGKPNGTPFVASLLNGPSNPTPPILRIQEGARLQVEDNARLDFQENEAVPPVLDVSGLFKINGTFFAMNTGNETADGYAKIEDTSAGNTGIVAVPLGGTLDVSSSFIASNTLEVQPALRLYYGSKLTLLLNPATLDNHKLVTRGELLLGKLDDPTDEDLLEGYLQGEPTLDLQIGNNGAKDAILPLGTKFVLVDYDPNHPPSGYGYFKSEIPGINGNLTDGRIFQLGLNQYQIRYADADYGAAHGGNSSVITLTVVHEPPVPAPTLSYAEPPTWPQNSPLTLMPTVGQLVGTGTYSLQSGTLPDGMTFDPNTGVISGTPTTARQNTSATIRLTDGATNLFTEVVVDLHIGVPSTAPLVHYATIQATVGNGPVTSTPTQSSIPPGAVWSVYPDSIDPLPAGFTLDPGTGVISGTPSVAPGKVVDVQVQVCWGGCDPANNEVVIGTILFWIVPSLQSVDLSYPDTNAIIGKYLSILPTVSGLAGPGTYTVFGVLPDGLSLDPATGVIMGVPTGAPGSYEVLIVVTDTYGYGASALAITLSAAPPPPNPIPTLSEWAQIGMMLSLLGALGWSYQRVRR